MQRFLRRACARRLPRVLAALALCVGLGALAAAPAPAAEVQVAVASNFAGAMDELAAAFERETGHRAVVALGSTGRFNAQVRNGAPFEVLLAADEATPAALERDGYAVGGTRFTYALGRLVLWSRDPSRVDAAGAVLRRPPGDARLAIADPRLAPYGAAALQVLDALGVRAAWTPRLVQGENIAQAWQFVASGNVALGLVARSQVEAGARRADGSGWLVPASLHAPIRQDVVLLARGRDRPAARALLEFLRGPEARRIIVAHGYER